MIKTFTELPRWNFELDEVSAGVYKVVGSHKSGHTVTATGTDMDELIEQCKNDAQDISRSLGLDRPLR